MWNRISEPEGISVRTRLACIAVVLAAITVVSCGSKEATPPPEATGPIIDSVASADGVIIHYQVHGSGSPAIVFVHGWCNDGYFWSDQVEVMELDHQVIVLDLAGHGNSGSNRTDWTISSFGADVAAVVNKVDPEKIILVGHSMGGAVNVEAARLLGDRVLGLIGVDTYQNIAMKYPEQQQQMFLNGLQEDFEGFTRKFVTQMFPTSAEPALVAEVVEVMAMCDPEVGRGAMKSLFAYDGVAALKDMRKPIRSINTDAFPTNVEENRKFAASFEVTIMPGHGHFLHLEDPQTFNQHLKAYVAELSGEKQADK